MTNLPVLEPTAIPDVLWVGTKWFADDRGCFSEVYNRDAFVAVGIAADFIQDNHAVSAKAGTVRGLHFQRPPAAQAKLVRVAKGAVWDVVVDIRQGSPWWGRWVAMELSARDRRQLFVPAGFAHGYVTLEPDTEVLYKVDAPYRPDCEDGIRWDDPSLDIPWPIPPGGPTVAPRDRTLPGFADLRPCFTYSGGAGA